MKPDDGKLIDILPVEDDAADVRLTREALKGATVKIRLHVGRQALGEIKGDPAPKHMPVVMFTRSKAEADIATAFELQANGYVIKPVELDQFLEAVRSMEGFLVGIVDTPPATEHDAT
jgi:DNA-binding NarL/FixJ family response regulator